MTPEQQRQQMLLKMKADALLTGRIVDDSGTTIKYTIDEKGRAAKHEDLAARDKAPGGRVPVTVEEVQHAATYGGVKLGPYGEILDFTDEEKRKRGLPLDRTYPGGITPFGTSDTGGGGELPDGGAGSGSGGSDGTIDQILMQHLGYIPGAGGGGTGGGGAGGGGAVDPDPYAFEALMGGGSASGPVLSPPGTINRRASEFPERDRNAAPTGIDEIPGARESLLNQFREAFSGSQGDRRTLYNRYLAGNQQFQNVTPTAQALLSQRFGPTSAAYALNAFDNPNKLQDFRSFAGDTGPLGSQINIGERLGQLQQGGRLPGQGETIADWQGRSGPYSEVVGEALRDDVLFGDLIKQNFNQRTNPALRGYGRGCHRPQLQRLPRRERRHASVQ